MVGDKGRAESLGGPTSPLRVPGVDIQTMGLSPDERAVWALIDGRTSADAIADTMGLDPTQVRDPISNDRPRRTVARPDTVPESLREALAKQVSAQFERTPLGDAMAALSQQSGASIIIDQQAGLSPKDGEVTLALAKPVPLATALQALSDLNDFVFVFREDPVDAPSIDQGGAPAQEPG